MKSIISCPSCQHRMRIPADRHIRLTCPKCQAFIKAKNGRITTHTEPIELRSRKSWWKRMSKVTRGVIIGLLALVVFVIMSMVYSITQQENLMFAEINANRERTTVEHYLLFYPNGKYTEAVTQMRDSLDFMDTQKDIEKNCGLKECDCSALQELHERPSKYRSDMVAKAYGECLLNAAKSAQPFASLKAYQAAFPDGEFLDSIVQIENQLWDTLGVLYTERNAARKVSTKAKTFVEALLAHGQESYNQRIGITFSNELALKDWTDYSPEAHQRLDDMIELDRMMTGHNYPAPTASPPPSIRTYLRDNSGVLQKLIIDALQARLDSVFIPNPFHLELVNEDENDSIPKIKIDYTVSTLSLTAEGEGELEIPSLYVQTKSSNYLETPQGERRLADLLTRANRGEDVTKELEELKGAQKTAAMNNRAGIFQNYLLASQINWKLVFSVPEKAEDYSVTSKSQPNNSFSNIQSNTDAYRRMMESAFVNYAIQIAEDFGL